MVIASLAYLGYLIDGYQQFWLRLAWGFDSELSFYYICGALLLFALLGLSGCFITCCDRRVRNDLAQPCQELCLCCCHPGLCADCHLPGTLSMWTDCTTCSESCAGMCFGGHNGWATNLAAALSHTSEEDGNKGWCCTTRQLKLLASQVSCTESNHRVINENMWLRTLTVR